MRKFLSLCGLLSGVLLACGCASLRLSGSVSGGEYTSAQGNFSVPFPVSPEVGGRVRRDNAESVSFRDNWGSQISFYSAAFNAQSSMTSVLRAQGRAQALEAFAKAEYGDLIVPHYHPEIREGAISFIFLKPVGPKTGVAAFLSGDRIYWVATDLLPGVQLLAQTDEASQRDRETWLENRALSLLQTMKIR
ncbi:MAG TPA: hypothetical protein VFC44_16145 [Candidatus Saccharimonadales bacterium]|nr:hypothetical protein [Candidatus Saccharimonadales bacterium]